ncbi:dihydrofolate reductase-like domain-containing protein [Xylaria bambusicola]|uniref:dihydrofolate reductase-like domain-containing protein n=1 Tax=Xylaria bambusicola TaxID=326684 RepID=UPI002007B38D|nr:dihydrofolate reductase-like domain-containing protein [Xylaria bambusicola]KAI0509343.1 dihydrofolate reductase-like domain-containing protein [Xylaria bambusicola]
MAETPLYFPSAERERLEPHLPTPKAADPSSPSCATLPFVTLTFATSLDSALSLGPGIRTALSGPESKAMTHYLRTRHDAICVGVGTAIADDPGLNSRLNAATHQPRPIIVDPRLRWDFTAQSKVMRLARESRGLAPYIVTLEKELPLHKKKILEDAGGKFIILTAGYDGEGKTDGARFDWRSILSAVRQEGLHSIMIEGGGEVINSLLSEDADLVDSVIVTIAPIWLGQGGVAVSPPRANADRPVARLSDTMWMPLGADVVLCGKIAR